MWFPYILPILLGKVPLLSSLHIIIIGVWSLFPAGTLNPAHGIHFPFQASNVPPLGKESAKENHGTPLSSAFHGSSAGPATLPHLDHCNSFLVVSASDSLFSTQHQGDPFKIQVGCQPCTKPCSALISLSIKCSYKSHKLLYLNSLSCLPSPLCSSQDGCYSSSDMPGTFLS